MPAFRKSHHPANPAAESFTLKEDGIEYGFVGKLQNLKYEQRPDIRDRSSLEKNFREKFEALNRVRSPAPSSRAIRAGP